MLRPITQPFCGGALDACLKLQMHLVRWLCDPTTSAADVTKINLAPPRVPTQIEADWLWRFLYGRKQTRLGQAKVVAGLSVPEKTALIDWSQAVVNVAAQFQPAPLPWPVASPAIPHIAWAAFKNLMEAFYERGLHSGLPYKPDGTPVAAGGVCYADYVEAFRNAHRANSGRNSRDVCVLCGGPLGQTPEVDHWIAKSTYPLLSICADNLLPICGGCNSTANKGEKAVHSGGNFADWFHPYLRPGNEAFRLDYMATNLKIHLVAIDPADQKKTDNLNRLLNLADRWTSEFKSEYLDQQDLLRRRERNRIKDGEARHTQAEIGTYLQKWHADLSPNKPYHEVHQVVAAALREPARVAALHAELQSL